LIGGMGNILIPILIGCNDMIFPRLNLFSLWLSFFSLILICLSLLIDSGVNAGWTFYVPLSKMNYSSIDLLFFSLHLAGLSSLFGSINFISSILSISSFSLLYLFNFIELFSWSIFFTSLLLIISIPVLAACITMIISDRHFNSCFFDPLRGGDLLLFQHLFWFFGHPEVYILILPAFGLVSTIITKFTQFIIFGRDSMLIALFLIGLLGCIVWGHHMFVVGFDIDSRAYFTSSTSIIGVPTGIKLLNWLLTLWSNLYYLITPLFFILGFLLSFSFGGFTGLILANSIIDLILHDSYFVVGHFHYVLSLGAVYTIFAGFYTYSLFLLNFSYLHSHTHLSYISSVAFSISPIAFNDFIGRLAYIAFFISSNLLFLPMHTLGIFGFPRRIFDYSINFYRFHWLSSLSLIGIGFSLLLFLLSFYI
jgi:heme/copper-type cytochrome/quinol oxidase subunit 1